MLGVTCWPPAHTRPNLRYLSFIRIKMKYRDTFWFCQMTTEIMFLCKLNLIIPGVWNAIELFPHKMSLQTITSFEYRKKQSSTVKFWTTKLYKRFQSRIIKNPIFWTITGARFFKHPFICPQLIFSGEYTKAMNKDWHSGHFCCWQCDESLTGQRYVLRDEHPYCIKCYESVFANGCEECNKIIGIDSKVRKKFEQSFVSRKILQKVLLVRCQGPLYRNSSNHK